MDKLLGFGFIPNEIQMTKREMWGCKAELQAMPGRALTKDRFQT